MTVLAAILEHRITCFGYVFQEGEQTGKLNVNLLKSMGLPPGPLYSKLKNGECIITSNGIVVQPRDVLMSPIPGRKVVVLGDTCNSSQLNDIAMNADVLVHEATNENAHQLKCVENGHSTPGLHKLILFLYFKICSFSSLSILSYIFYSHGSEICKVNPCKKTDLNSF